MTFKPMLASPIEDTSTLKFPVLVSIKLDGIRATRQSGRLLTRSLKEVPNRHIQTKFANLPEGLDGELIYGNPAHPDCYRTTTSIVMSEDKDPAGIKFWAFDTFEPGGFEKRYDYVGEIVFNVDDQDVGVVHHRVIKNGKELLRYE